GWLPLPSCRGKPRDRDAERRDPGTQFRHDVHLEPGQPNAGVGYYIGRCRSGSTHSAALLHSDEVHVRISRMQRRFIVLIATIGAVSVAWWWWSRASAPISAPLEERTTQPLPPVTAPAAAERPARPMLPPALQLAKPVVLRPAPAAVPGALEGVVLDAATGEAIAGAELTFSHHDGAYVTSTGTGGTFRFAPRGPGVYGLVSIEAKGYAPFESEFGRSPASFTSVPGKDVSGVVLRLARERRRGADSDGGRRDRHARDGADAGEPSPTGSLFGHVVDARSRAPVAAFAIALFRRDGMATRLVAPASFIDPSGNYRVDGLSPGTYEA